MSKNPQPELFGYAVRDDLVLDLVVGRLRNDALLRELVLRGVRTALDDAVGVSIPNAGQRLQLVRSRGVDVQQLRAGRGLGGLR